MSIARAIRNHAQIGKPIHVMVKKSFTLPNAAATALWGILY